MPTPFDAFGYIEATLTVKRADADALLAGLLLDPIIGTGVADSRPRPVQLGNYTHLIREMLAGNHWLGGFGWIGPRPQESAVGYADTMRLVQQGFVSENVLAEVTERHVAGVLGREPRWSIVPRRNLPQDEEPTAEEQATMGEAEAMLTEWWDKRKAHKFLETACGTLLYARRSVVRLYVPRGKLASENITDETGRAKTIKVIRAADVPAGLDFIWPDAPVPELSTVAVDPDTKELIGVVIYRSGQTVTGTGAGKEVAELTYLAEPNAGGPPLTMIRQAAAGGATGTSVRLDFGGRLSMYEMTRAPFVTTQMIQLQRALNLSLTVLPRNLIQAGWLERVISNAQMPGKWIADASAANGKRWVPDTHVTGGGATTYLRGLKMEGVEGQITYATPSVQWREPSPTQPTVEAQNALYREIIHEAKQEHVLISGDARPSGVSRVQARADFETTLRATATEVNALGRWFIETLLAMAEAFAGTPGLYTNEFRANFECQVDTGPINAQERTAIDASVTAGTLSRETAMSLEGIGDPAAELALLSAEPGANIDVLAKQITAWVAMVAAGADMEAAALVVGIDPKLAKKLAPKFDDANPDPNDPNAPPKDNPGNLPPNPASA